MDGDDGVFSLLSVTVVYFAAGVVVQKFVFKKEGVEMIPNSAFWLVLPGLIKVLLPSALALSTSDVDVQFKFVLTVASCTSYRMVTSLCTRA
jgi:hypothetical protein